MKKLFGILVFLLAFNLNLTANSNVYQHREIPTDCIEETLNFMGKASRFLDDATVSCFANMYYAGCMGYGLSDMNGC